MMEDTDTNPASSSQEKSSSRKKKLPPKWISSYNFLSLLNLEEEMKLYGPPRCHYEGTYKGEKFVSNVKPIIESGLQGNWARNCLRAHWTNYVTNALNGSYDNTEKSSRISKKFKIYDATPQLQFCLGKGHPISGCISEEGRLLVAIACGKRRDTCKFVGIELKNCGITYCGAAYFEVNMMDSDYENLLDYDSVEIEDYFILLPIVPDAPIFNEGSNHNRLLYTMITEEWNEQTIVEEVQSYRNV